MTRLLDDLTALADQHRRAHPDMLVPVPAGAIRAAVTMLTRLEQLQLADRKSRAEWMFNRVDIRGLKGRGRHSAERKRHA